MIVEFSVSNFKSIRHKQTLSLQAASIVSKDPGVDERNLFHTSTGIDLLKSVAIFGPNGSGKSNLVKALIRMLNFINKSFQDETQVRSFFPFALDMACLEVPQHFELIFIHKGNRYRYGFEITRSGVSAEWLFGPANTNEVEYFTREGNEIHVNKSRFKEGTELPDGKTKPSNLFLNVVHAYNGPIAGEIMSFLKDTIIVSMGMNDDRVRKMTIDRMKNEDFRQEIVRFVQSADVDLDDIINTEVQNPKLAAGEGGMIQNQPEDTKPLRLLGSVKAVKSPTGMPLKLFFEFDSFQSEGTKKFFTYSGPILESLQQGKTLVIDEFDARLHPTLTRKIVETFNSKTLNPNNAQLIFVTHDVNLLDPDLMRRDQIYFTEKNRAGETDLFSLINIGGVRNDTSYERDYMKGKYGALPYLEKFNAKAHEQD